MPKPSVKKVVLAYSGGLDTSVIVPWLRENYDCEVICFCADIGQKEELSGLDEKAKASGASKLIIKDLRDEFASDYLFPLLQSSAVYERKYLLGTSVARPLIAKYQVMIAQEEGADAVAHGCTGKGNDQVRFELTYTALDPRLKAIVPWREWSIRSRQDALEYAQAHNVPVTATRNRSTAATATCGISRTKAACWKIRGWSRKRACFNSASRRRTRPMKPQFVTIDFVRGVPVAIDGQEYGPAALIETLNEIGGKHGIGRVDLVENRLVGMKSHGVYETPGGTILLRRAARTRIDHARSRYAALQRYRGAALCRTGVQRPVVHAAARGAASLL